MKQHCETCHFFTLTTDTETLCHRFPPTPPRQWAQPKPDDWCGEYRKRSIPKGDSTKPVAIVTSLTIRETVYKLMDDPRVQSIDNSTVGGRLVDGRRFRIVTQQTRLDGLEFSAVSLVGSPIEPLLGEVRRRVSKSTNPVAVVSTLSAPETARTLATDPRFSAVDMARNRGILRDGRPFLLVYNQTIITGLEFSAVIILGPQPDRVRLSELHARVRP